MRAILKSAAESVLAHGGPAGMARRGRRGRTLILGYHGILPDGEEPWGDRSLHLPERAFRAQMDSLARSHDVVPLADVLGTPGVSGQRPRAAITFDDAYRGAVDLGVDILARLGLPATIFVAPAFLGQAGFWWDALAGRAGLSDADRRHALNQCRGQDPAVRNWAREAGRELASAPGFGQVASEAELASAVARGGITLGSHTWSHPNLARLGAAEVAAELSRPLEWLTERYSSAVIPWLAYPYGLFTAEVEQAAQAVGYRAALAISGGWLGPDSRSFALPRLNIPAGVSAAGFTLRTSGLVG